MGVVILPCLAIVSGEQRTFPPLSIRSAQIISIAFTLESNTAQAFILSDLRSIGRHSELYPRVNKVCPSCLNNLSPSVVFLRHLASCLESCNVGQVVMLSP